jgi:hypothetical protein
MAIFALIVIAGSVQAGIGWGSEGPKAGFFPFYIGLTILGSSIINFATVFAERPDGQLFAEWGQLRKVLSMLVPTTIYVALVPWLGIYVASALLIAVFMRWLGGYGWRMLVAIALGVPVAIRDLREMVPGAVAEGTDRGAAGSFDGRDGPGIVEVTRPIRWKRSSTCFTALQSSSSRTTFC